MELHLISHGEGGSDRALPCARFSCPCYEVQIQQNLSNDLVYARLSLWAIPDVSILCFLSIIIRNMFSLDTGCRGVYSGSCKLVFCIILWENIFFVLMHN